MDRITNKKFNLTEADIVKTIENAFESAKQNVTMVNMNQLLKNEHIYSLAQLSQFIKNNISKSSSKVVDHAEGINFDEESDVDEFQDEENNIETPDDTEQVLSHSRDEDEDEDEENVVSSGLPDIEQQNFYGCRIYDTVNSQQLNKYFRIRIGSSVKYLHKQTACWLLRDDRSRLSSDRLVRVQRTEK